MLGAAATVEDLVRACLKKGLMPGQFRIPKNLAAPNVKNQRRGGAASDQVASAAAAWLIFAMIRAVSATIRFRMIVPTLCSGHARPGNLLYLA